MNRKNEVLELQKSLTEKEKLVRALMWALFLVSVSLLPLIVPLLRRLIMISLL